VVWSVSVASRYVPKATCLVQALAMKALLDKEGHPANLQIGVMKDEGGKFQAHAWVESQDRILNGGSEVATYKAFNLQSLRVVFPAACGVK